MNQEWKAKECASLYNWLQHRASGFEPLSNWFRDIW